MTHLRDRLTAGAMRVVGLAAGWLAVFTALQMTSGHSSWEWLGANTPRVALVQAVLLCIVADVLFLVVLSAKGGERLRVVTGFFAVMGMFLSIAALSWIRGLWKSGVW